MMSGMAAEIVLIERDWRRAEGHVNDLRDAEVFSHTTRIFVGDFSDCCSADGQIWKSADSQRRLYRSHDGRLETQFFNVFNHPNFGLPSLVLAGIPGKPSTQTGFGALTYTTSPPTGLLGVGLGGDSTPRMIAFQLRLEF